MKRASSIVLFAVLALFAHGDERRPFDEYGTPSDLKGLTKVYVDAGLEVEPRTNFIETVKRKLPSTTNITFPDSGDGAEVIVVLTFQYTNGNVYATMIVLQSKPDGKLRLLMKESDQKTSRLTKRCSTVLGERFAAAYRTANGL